MQPVDDVDFGERLVRPGSQLVPQLLERHRVRARVARPQTRERAEQTARHAHVGGLESDIEVVERPRAVALLALPVREPSKRQQIRTLEQPHAVLERQPDAGVELIGDIRHACGC
jgi:hypothetical protein